MVTIDEIVEIISKTGVVEDMSKFDPCKTFKDNGVDSLDLFTILLAVEERRAVKFSNEESENLSSVLRIIELLNNR